MPVQINGATSGSATLQATDATTVTITLPSTSGTLAVSAGSPSFSTLTVTGNTYLATSSGSVGIGTTSPNGALQVVGVSSSLPASNGNLIVSTNSAVAADIGGTVALGGYYTGTTYTQWAGLAGKKDNATDGDYSGYLALYTRLTGAALQERMRIDSSGRVTMPYQPAFWASAGSGTQSILTGTYTQVTGMNSTKYNVGSNYDTSTSTFTAPIAGVYIFKYRVSITTAVANQISGGNDYQLKLYVNGSDYVVSGSNGDYGGQPVGYFAAMTGVAIYSLNAGDTVRVYIYQSTGSTQTLSTPMCNFSGSLLH